MAEEDVDAFLYGDEDEDEEPETTTTTEVNVDATVTSSITTPVDGGTRSSLVTTHCYPFIHLRISILLLHYISLSD